MRCISIGVNTGAATCYLKGLQSILSRSHPAKNGRLRTCNQMRLRNLPAFNTFILTPQSGLAHLYMLETAKAEHVRRALASLDRCVALRSVGAMVCGCMGVQLNRYARLRSYIE